MDICSNNHTPKGPPCRAPTPQWSKCFHANSWLVADRDVSLACVHCHGWDFSTLGISLPIPSCMEVIAPRKTLFPVGYGDRTAEMAEKREGRSIMLHRARRNGEELVRVSGEAPGW